MILTHDSKLKQTKTIGLILLSFLVIFLAYQFLLRKRIESNGVYLKGTITAIGGHKSRVATVSYEYGGKKYIGYTHSESGQVGRIYFIKVLPTDPTSMILLENKRVPRCLLNVESPKDGWKEMPTCEEEKIIRSADETVVFRSSAHDLIFSVEIDDDFKYHDSALNKDVVLGYPIGTYKKKKDSSVIDLRIDEKDTVFKYPLFEVDSILFGLTEHRNFYIITNQDKYGWIID